MAERQLTQEERRQWSALYDNAAAIWRLSPWGWCATGDCFGIQPAGCEEPVFTVFCEGLNRDHRILRFPRGWRALFDFLMRTQSPTKPVVTWMLEIPMMELAFLPQNLLFPHENALCRAMDMASLGPETLFPVFRSIHPGYQPWFPDAKELAMLEVLLYQTFGMLLRTESDPRLLRCAGPGHVLVVRQDASNGTWHDTTPESPAFSDDGVKIRLKAAMLERLGHQPLRPARIQLDLQFLPIVPGFTPDMGLDAVFAKSLDTRPETLYALIAADTETGAVLHTGLLRAADGITKMWNAVPDLIAELFERTGGCPEVIEVTGDRMSNLMHTLETYLPFKLVLRKKLALVEHVADRLGRKLMDRQDSREKATDGKQT